MKTTVTPLHDGIIEIEFEDLLGILALEVEKGRSELRNKGIRKIVITMPSFRGGRIYDIPIIY